MKCHLLILVLFYFVNSPITLTNNPVVSDANASPIIIFQKIDSVFCVDWKVLQYEASNGIFEQKLDNKVEGAFYHYDENNQILTIEQDMGEELIKIEQNFYYKNKFYEVHMCSCKQFLGLNRPKLKEIVKKIYK